MLANKDYKNRKSITQPILWNIKGKKWYGHCKFQTDFSYIHPDPVEANNKLEEDIVDNKETLQKVLSTLALKEIEIKRLEEKFPKLEENSIISVNENNTCEICQY